MILVVVIGCKVKCAMIVWVMWGFNERGRFHTRASLERSSNGSFSVFLVVLGGSCMLLLMLLGKLNDPLDDLPLKH